MKKTGLLAIVVLAVAVLGLPAVFGGLTRSQVDARIAEINADGVLSVTVDEYTRGWFKSTADLSLRLSPEYVERLGARADALPARLAGTGALPVRAELGHGPAGWHDGPFVGLSKVVARANRDVAWVRDTIETYGLPYLFEFRGRTGFTGRVAFTADVPAFDTANTGGDTRFSGARIEGTLAGNHLVAELDAAELDAAAPGLSMITSGLHAEIDSRFLDDNRTVGTASLEIAELGVTGPATGPSAGSVRVTGVRVTTEGALEDGSWHTRFDYASDAIETTSGTRIESAALGIGLDNLDAAAFDELRALLESAAVDPATGTPNVAPPDLQTTLNRILAGSPSLELAPISFSREGDAFDATVRLDVRENASLNLAQLGTSPLAFLGIVNGAVDATIAKPLAQRLAADVARAQLAAQPGRNPAQQGQLAETQATLMLVMLAGQGYLEETDDAYSTRIRLADGTVTINGESVPMFGLP